MARFESRLRRLERLFQGESLEPDLMTLFTLARARVRAGERRNPAPLPDPATIRDPRRRAMVTELIAGRKRMGYGSATN
jgi:hypothetical protein